MFMYYTVSYFTGIFCAVVRPISMLFIDNKDSVFCIYKYNSQRAAVQKSKVNTHVGPD